MQCGNSQNAMNAFQIFDIANDRLLVYIEYGQQIRSEMREVKPAVDGVKRLVVKARRPAGERNVSQCSQWKFFRRHSLHDWVNNLRLRIRLLLDRWRGTSKQNENQNGQGGRQGTIRIK